MFFPIILQAPNLSKTMQSLVSSFQSGNFGNQRVTATGSFRSFTWCQSSTTWCQRMWISCTPGFTMELFCSVSSMWQTRWLLRCMTVSVSKITISWSCCSPRCACLDQYIYLTCFASFICSVTVSSYLSAIKLKGFYFTSMWMCGVNVLMFAALHFMSLMSLSIQCPSVACHTCQVPTLHANGESQWIFDVATKKVLVSRIYTVMTGSVVTVGKKKNDNKKRGADKENMNANKRARVTPGGKAKAKAKSAALAMPNIPDEKGFELYNHRVHAGCAQQVVDWRSSQVCITCLQQCGFEFRDCRLWGNPQPEDAPDRNGPHVCIQRADHDGDPERSQAVQEMVDDATGIERARADLHVEGMPVWNDFGLSLKFKWLIVNSC